MPRKLSQEDIQQLRNMPREARHERNINRIADALEDICDELHAMNERAAINPLK